LQFSGKTASTLLSSGMPFQLEGERADGVSEGSPIYYRGVPVGRVERVQLQSDNSGVIISAILDAERTVPENVVGYVRPSSALSMAAGISLEVEGPQSATPLAAGKTISALNRNQGLIPPEFTDLLKDVREQKLIAHV